MPLTANQRRKRKRIAKRAALQNAQFDREGLGDPLEESVIPDCVICLEKCKKDENLKWLPCMHVFHSQCISKWQKQQKKCPVCRRSYVNWFMLIIPNTFAFDFQRSCIIKYGKILSQIRSQRSPTSNLSQVWYARANRWVSNSSVK